MSEELAAVPSVPVDYDIPTGTYGSFIDDLRAKLAKHPHPDNVEGHPVLAKQLWPQEPARWMYCNLKAAAAGGEHKSETEEATLAVRDDNVYLIGFRAQSGKWYEFGFEGKTVRMLPGSTFLECDVDYRSLVGGASSKEVRANLTRMRLSKSLAEDGVGRLSGYGVKAGAAPDAATKLALARLIVMVCESARMISISSTVSNGWAGGSGISSQQVDYLWNWALMSQALLGWRAYGPRYKWPARLAKIGVRNKDDALSVVQLLLNKPAPPPEQQLAMVDGEEDEAAALVGRALVEVFSVRADFPVIGTIAVFDGIRGQIIYHGNNDRSPAGTKQQVDELVLTGPYRAISAAHGNCTIQVIGAGSADDGCTGTLRCWDCYGDDHGGGDAAALDAPLTRAISTARGPVEVTYAVLSNAVEATIQVKLLAGAGTRHVHGKVTARSGAFHGAAGSVTIFSRDPDDDDQVAVVATDGDCTVPLDRTVVAAPLGSPLVVEVTLIRTSGNNNVAVQGRLEFDPDLSGEHVKLLVPAAGEQEHCAVEVKVTWSDI